MKRLAWWAIGVGLGVEVMSQFAHALSLRTAFDLATDSGKGSYYESVWYLVGALASVGDTVLLCGVILLAATVVADAQRKTSVTPESP